MTEQPDDQPTIVRLDGDEFVSTLTSLAASLAELVAHVAVMEQRLSALERGRGKRKGFEP
jgi:hypothetical protein